MKLKKFEDINKSKKLNESFFDKVDTVKDMEVVAFDNDESYDLYLQVTARSGMKYYAKLKDESHFNGDEGDGN